MSVSRKCIQFDLSQILTTMIYKIEIIIISQRHYLTYYDAKRFHVIYELQSTYLPLKNRGIIKICLE